MENFFTKKSSTKKENTTMREGKTMIYGETKPVLTKSEEDVMVKFRDAVKEVRKEVERVEKRKQAAGQRIADMKMQLNISGASIMTVEDKAKRAKLLEDHKKMEDELKEEELYLQTNTVLYLKQLAEKHNLEGLYSEVCEIRTRVVNELGTHAQSTRVYLHEVSTDWRNQAGTQGIILDAENVYRRYKKKINLSGYEKSNAEYAKRLIRKRT